MVDTSAENIILAHIQHAVKIPVFQSVITVDKTDPLPVDPGLFFSSFWPKRLQTFVTYRFLKVVCYTFLTAVKSNLSSQAYHGRHVCALSNLGIHYVSACGAKESLVVKRLLEEPAVV